jgi:hypothetical protein
MIPRLGYSRKFSACLKRKNPLVFPRIALIGMFCRRTPKSPEICAPFHGNYTRSANRLIHLKHSVEAAMPSRSTGYALALVMAPDSSDVAL